MLDNPTDGGFNARAAQREKIADQAADAILAALAAQQDGVRDGSKYVRTLDECEVVVTHPDYHPVIVNMATFEVTRLWDDGTHEQRSGQ